MILYALACINGHRFESWFRNNAGYDEQTERGLINCPVCQSTDVAKSIMAPAVVSRATTIPALQTPIADASVPLLDERQLAARSALKAIRDHVLSSAEDVGSSFPDQARRMHDGDIPHRQIHGQATVDEVRALVEDGVSILPLPSAPDELN